MQPVMPVKIEFLLTGSVSQKISEAERDFYFLVISDCIKNICKHPFRAQKPT